MNIVYGARCTWWDTVDQAATKPLPIDVCQMCGKKHLFGIPPACLHGEPLIAIACCPHCAGELIEIDAAVWARGIVEQENAGRGPLVSWSRGKCFANLAALEAAFELERVS